MKKIPTINLFLPIIVIFGCTFQIGSDSLSYESEYFTLNYPSDYVLKEAENKVTISNEEGKIVINSAIDGPGGVDLENMTKEEIEQLPKYGKAHSEVPPIGSALYFISGDKQTEFELLEIQESIILK